MTKLSCDVVVAGGGIAGIAAALAAARRGADVILLEKQCVLGGLATSGIVTIYLPLCDGRGTQVSYGIAQELLHLSILHNIQDKKPEPWLRPASREERAGRRYEVQFNPVYFMLEAEALLIKEGVRILYDTRVVGAAVHEGVLRSVDIEDESGRGTIECHAAVDATGSAALLRLCGEETERHALGNSIAGWYYASTRQGMKLKMLGFSDVARDTAKETFQMATGNRFAGDNGEEVSRYLQLSHQATLTDLKKREQSDEQFIEPALMTAMPQFRMIRRLAGEASMTESDDGKPAESSIGMVSDWRKCGPRYEVPYGCLYGKTANLYAAGRVVSCDDGMWDILRVIPCCAVTGEAAGTAAALTPADGQRAQLTAVQSALSAAGQRLHLTELD